ncbi:MAG: hypothetical protein DWH79_11800 [Planctomycetota bacterium]|nr:MAG: hypothetical protein DWH79_11800 [Planctomycetota bacterium]
MGGLLAWARLLRLPNHFTAVADVLAGYLVVAGLKTVIVRPEMLWAVAAGWLFYAAGMVLNDVFDVALDRKERPERPLPSGVIEVATAARVGQGLLALAGMSACVTAVLSGHPAPALVGACLTSSIWMYDRHAKGTPWGPAVMGLCRGLNWLLGMSAAGGPEIDSQWLLPLGIAVYVAGITLYARDEASASRRASLARATGVMALGLLLAGLGTWLTVQASGTIPWAAAAQPGIAIDRLTGWMLLWSMVSLSILLRALLGVLEPVPERVRAAVGNAIMSLITLDAALVLAACGEQWAVVILLLLAPFMFLRQFIPPT